MVVDYERGRTNKSWLPRRLGGGKGDTRKAREPRHIIEAKEAERYGNDSGGGGYREDRSYRERSTHSRERSSRRHESRDREERGDRNGGSDRHRERNGSSDRHRDRERRDDKRRRD